MRWRICALVLLLLTGACSYRTAGSPQGDLTIHATFDDVANLVVGHSVQMAGITIGTITEVELDGYKAKVTMSIADGQDIPEDVTAVLAKTSLLGENFVDLQLDGELAGPFLASGDAVSTTRVRPEFELVTSEAIEFLGALNAQDLNTILDSGVEAFGDRGTDLNALVRDLGAVVGSLDDQKEDIVSLIDSFAVLTDGLAANDDTISTLIDDLDGASSTLAEHRTQMVTAIEGLTTFAADSTRIVLKDHADELASTLQDLDPLVAEIAANRALVEDMLDQAAKFLVKIGNNVNPGSESQAQYIWARGLEGGDSFFPDVQQPPPPLPGFPGLPPLLPASDPGADLVSLLDPTGETP